MEGLFTIVLGDIVSVIVTANAIVYSLLVVNTLLLVLISHTVLRNVNSVFPTCQVRSFRPPRPSRSLVFGSLPCW